MADYVVVAANVLLGATGTQTRDGIAGVTITAGQALYKDATDGKLKLTDANSVTAAAHVLEGIALNGAAANQPVQYVLKDPNFAPGVASLPAGDVVCLSSANPGGLCPDADMTTGDFVVVVGVGTGSNKINLTGTPIAASVAKP